MKYVIWLLFTQCFLSINVNAQQVQKTSLRALLDSAESRFPALRSKSTEVQATRTSVQLAKNSVIPSLDASYQVNYATHNNITGMAYPQFLVPISGPPSADNDYRAVFGSAASLILNWQPLTFGQRNASIEQANASLNLSSNEYQMELFRYKTNLIDAWISLVLAEDLVKIHSENLKRVQINLDMIRPLVNSGINPGVDTALFKAEVSKAKLELMNHQNVLEQARINFSQWIASDTIPLITDTSFLHRLPGMGNPQEPGQHPLSTLYASMIEYNIAQKKSISKTTMPTLGVWSTIWARGSGIDYTGAVNPKEGLGLQRYNYGLGAQLSFPILQSAKIKPRLSQQDLVIQSYVEKKKDVDLQLRKQQEMAEASFQYALRIANELPELEKSATYAYNAVRSRYTAGLSNFANLVQAQYSLLKAETDQKAAQVNVWRYLLRKAMANGDLSIFLNQVN